MPMFEHLKVKTGQVIRSSWANELVDSIQMVSEKGAVDYYGYVHKDLIPDKDLALNLGLENLRFKEIHAGYGNFTYELKVQDKRVIKDEDPIHIATFYDYAAYQIKQAIKDALLNLGIPPKPTRIGIKVAYPAGAFTDIFDPDLTMNYDGRARFKLSGYEDFVAYVKHIPDGFVTEIIAALNAANVIEKDTWAEFDFTVNENDKINVRVIPSTTVTVIVYNIPEA